MLKKNLEKGISKQKAAELAFLRHKLNKKLAYLSQKLIILTKISIVFANHIKYSSDSVLFQSIQVFFYPILPKIE